MKDGPDQTESRPARNRSAFKFHPPPSALEFDGERYVSGIVGDIQSEHYHRYLFSLSFCFGKDVLDVASGEGYGSALLGQVARSVVGVDLDQPSVDFANHAYLSNTVSFCRGSATELPIEDGSIEVVVSFETLEHLVDHEKFFSEILRVLRPGGMLIMSSPNKAIYSDQLGNQNKFHLRELDRAEFADSIGRHFAHHQLLEQRAVSGSVILGTAPGGPIEGFDSADGMLFHRHRGVPNPPYLIAVASNVPLPDIAGSVMHSPAYLAHLEQIRRGLDQDRSGARVALADAESRLAAAENVRAAMAREAETHAAAAATSDQERRAAVARLEHSDQRCLELEAALTQARDDLAGVLSSTSWRITFPIRRLLTGHPDLARLLRRTAKATWWLMTGRLATKVRAFHRSRAARRERPLAPPEIAVTVADTIAEPKATGRFRVPGPGFEELDPRLLDPAHRRAKIIALYLPQFHPIPENDAWWGKGFTEWRNVATAEPWFAAHHQPRLPRDLGFYDLRLKETIRAQIEIARSAGIFGFCFYYYFFGGRRILETPVELLLADRSIDFPFCILWANENWSRRWDGQDHEILLHQDYAAQDDAALIDDLARHFNDPRYITLGDRPLFILYRPNLIAGAADRIARWREDLRARHGLNPLIFMVQGFGSHDPQEFGLDGALEFPPHKVAQDLPTINHRIDDLNPAFHGAVYDYAEVVARSLAVEPPPFDLIRAVMPSWDNVPRRGAQGAIFHGSTPSLFQRWLEHMIDFATDHQVRGESLVFVNAWNEWAEGATLEPDLYWGGAYLNSTARALARPAAPPGKPKLLVLGHDANRNGAQLICLALVRHLRRSFGLEVTVVLLDGGPLESEFRAVATTRVIGAGAELEGFVKQLRAEGYRHAICNTVVTGTCVTLLDRAGFTVVSLVHEMPELVRDRGLEQAARDLAERSRAVVFPAGLVRDRFATLATVAPAKIAIEPQGLYLAAPVHDGARARLIRQLALPDDGIVALNVGYGDRRKGIDLFAQVAAQVVRQDARFHFVWVGDLAMDRTQWLADMAAPTQRNIHQVPFSTDIAAYYQAADLFVLTSREDPFPSVVLEALASGLPVVAFEDGGGYVELVGAPGNGVLVPYLDTAAMAASVVRVAGDPAWIGAEAVAQRRRAALDRFDFRRYASRLLRLLWPELETVSVIVPNYNYGNYLAQRLDTIFAQTYPIYEVIVLDDASTDDSLATLEAIGRESGREFRVIGRSHNSGSPLTQWAAGVAQAQGDLIWIAEADDLSAPDFVETLAAGFADPTLTLAFSDSRQIDAGGAPTADSYAYYYEKHLPALLQGATMPGLDFLEAFAAVRNPILNVSAVLFRADALRIALAAAAPALDALRMAGDWYVYATLASQKGTWRYIARPLNIHRRHRSSVTHALDTARHLDEIRRVHQQLEKVLGHQMLRGAQSAYIAELEAQFDTEVA